jgi:hypothetical protein
MVPEQMQVNKAYRFSINLPESGLSGIFRARVVEISSEKDRTFVLFDHQKARRQANVNGQNVNWQDLTPEQREAFSMHITTAAISGVTEYAHTF